MKDALFFIDSHPSLEKFPVSSTPFSSNPTQFKTWKPSLRYFMSSVLKCSVCGDPGHISTQCFKSLKKCIFCTNTGHSFKQCPDATCHNCCSPGHLSRQCKAQNNCSECTAAGHIAEKCISRPQPCNKNEVFQIKCLKCREFGHTNCGKITGNERLSKLQCFRCGIQGHLAEDCSGFKGDNKVELFRMHVKEALTELPEFHENMNCKERRYWDKVEKKAFKTLLKKKKIKQKRNKKKAKVLSKDKE